MAVADFELILRRWNASYYEAEARWQVPDDEALPAPVRQLIAIDLNELDLQRDKLKFEEYGRRLSEYLFTPAQASAVRDRFANARAWLRDPKHVDDAVRFRLFIDEGSPELHAVRWETLWDLDANKWLLSDPRFWFTRYLASRTHYPVHLRRKGPLRALLAVGNPNVLGAGYPKLVPLLPAAEREALEGVLPVANLAGAVAVRVEPVSDQAVTPRGIADRLRDGYDLLCLTCHGAVMDGVSRLWLHETNDQGKWVLSQGTDLVNAIRDLPDKPRLVVLKSCFSADGAQDPVLGVPAAIGPALALAGVPVVLALQGLAPVPTVTAFTQRFFSELREHGVVDRAAAAARCAVAGMVDPWMPVIFSRLRYGLLWYEPTFADYEDFECWPDILTQLEEGKCTAVLGPGLLEAVVGDVRPIARKLAEAFQCPLPDTLKAELPTVAQWVVAQSRDNTLRVKLGKILDAALTDRFGERLSPSGPQVPLPRRLHEAGELVRAMAAAANQPEAHTILAQLPIKVYINTNPDTLLADALRAAGRTPREVLCRWTDDRSVRWPDEPLPNNYEPTEDEPLVFYLYGRWDARDTVILTESNYFDLLTAIAETRQQLFPSSVLGAAVESGLVFLGFRLDDWTFRIPFHALLGRGRAVRTKYAHVAVQIEPDEGHWSDVQRARRVLEDYFDQSNILIYWGGALDFLEQLCQKAGRCP